VNDKQFSMYKFLYDPRLDPPCCLRELRLVIGNSRDKNFDKRLPGLLDFLNDLEKDFKRKPTTITKTKNQPHGFENGDVAILRADKRWLNNPPMLSLYALLIRIGLSHKTGKTAKSTLREIKAGLVKTYQPKDVATLKFVEPALHKIARIGDKKLFYRDIKLNYPVINKDILHNRMGIIGFANDMIQSKVGMDVVVSYWHRHR
jgi:hypothetical protein